MPAPPPKSFEAEFSLRQEAVLRSIQLHHRYLLHFLHEMTRQWQDAENLAQELWSYVLRRFPLEEMENLTLLRRKAKQLFLDTYRKKLRRGEHLSDLEVETALVGTEGNEEAHTEEEEAALKKRFFEQFPNTGLTAEQEEVLWLYGRYGYTLAELREQTGVPISTLSDWIRLGRERLAAALA